jgi:pyruvate formate lyase activating enzyme
MNDLSRRDFMRLAALGVAAASCPFAASLSRAAAGETEQPKLSDHEALAYEKLEGLRVRCVLCPRRCEVADRERGYCGVRENQGGTYRTLVYARACAHHVDPIEKKPLFHFLPGSLAFSIATAGCNFECKFCQNWQLSQFRPEQVDSDYLPPAKVAALAKEKDCRVIAYTYNEPTIFYEYVLDAAREGNKLGLRSVTISNGFILPDPMKELCKELGAVKIDLKGFTEKFYKDYTGGALKPVLATIELLKKAGVHNELVVLVIPGLNDGEDEIRQMSAWVVKTVGPDVPMHFTRFQPNYKMMNLSPTPVKTLERARDVAVAEGVHYAYMGNVPGHDYEHTYCHKCRKRIIGRYGFEILAMDVADGKCRFCGADIPGVWK